MAENTPIKLCVDCAHFVPGPFGEHRYAKCGRTVSPVHGGPGEFCLNERERGAILKCGGHGRHFVAKPVAVMMPGRLVSWLRKVW